MTTLQESAMLSRLKIAAWQGRKYDRKISDEVATTHNADKSAGRYNKSLIARDALAEISKVSSAARVYHYMMTLPWMDDGARILPAPCFLDYSAVMSKHSNEFDSAVASFVAAYPDLIEDARVKLNGMFNESDYPSVADIERRFEFDVPIMPLPNAEDFRVTVSDNDAARIKADIEQRISDTLDAAVQDVWGRIHKVVTKTSEKLRAYQPGGDKVKNPFRDTLIENVRDLVELLPKLNITGNAEIDRMTARLDNELCQHDASQLRDDPELRREVASEADRLLESMKQYYTG